MIGALWRNSFVRFAAVGVLTSAIYFALMWLGQSVLHLAYLATIKISYTVPTLFHFNATRIVTFDAKHRHMGKQLFRYVGMLVGNYGAQVLFAVVGIEY